MSGAFRLDPRLQADSLEIGRTGLSSVRLMDDARWPWILLVPERPDIREWFDLTEADARRLLEESRALARVMAAGVSDAKLNIANLGNIVAQFHLHHVVRTPADPAWPGPVWGFGERRPYPPAEARAQCAEWAGRLADLLLD